MARPVVVGLNAVIAAVTDETPRVLTVRRQDTSLPQGQSRKLDALPFGPLHPAGDRTLELGLRGWVREQTGIELGYVEQLYTFADRDRDPEVQRGGPRMISVAYLALVRETRPSGEGAAWQDWYQFFPWEDWRQGRPPMIDEEMIPALERWLKACPNRRSRDRQRERLDLVFGCGGATWNWERVLDRYELLYEAGLVWEHRHDEFRRQRPESQRRPAARKANLENRPTQETAFGEPMLLDHRRILATALDRIRGKLEYRPVVFELLPPTFTLLQLQREVEALAGLRLHKQNFRRLVEKGGLVERTGQLHHQSRGRPAELFRFRREVLWERPAPGVGLPGVH